MDPFWKDDISILYNKHRLIEFVPTADMSAVEKLNALTRLSVYAGLMLVIIYNNINYIYATLITMVLLVLIHEHHPNNNREQSGGAQTLVRPTKDNPFMNVLMGDYVGNPLRLPASNVEDVDIKRSINENFSKGLYQDVDDIWGKANSQRQYYTTPSTTIPNDVDSFMKWCWNTPYTCKDGNLANCLKYDDVRGHGQIV
jgi:hypothetical protein